MIEERKKAGFICVKDTLDGAYPSLVLAVNAARQGMESKVFFSFMGLNLLFKGGPEKSRFHPAGPLGAIPGMSWLATWMMKKKVAKANIPPLEDLFEMAQVEGVQLVACKMTMDMMELQKNQLIDDVVVWTAEDFMKYARECQVCLFT